jgi:hypothetical protein
MNILSASAELIHPFAQYLRGEELASKATARVLPKEKFAKALGYLRNQWDVLQFYLTDGRLPIDNNEVEQLMRQDVWAYAKDVLDQLLSGSSDYAPSARTAWPPRTRITSARTAPRNAATAPWPNATAAPTAVVERFNLWAGFFTCLRQSDPQARVFAKGIPALARRVGGALEKLRERFFVQLLAIRATNGVAWDVWID